MKGVGVGETLGPISDPGPFLSVSLLLPGWQVGGTNNHCAHVSIGSFLRTLCVALPQEWHPHMTRLQPSVLFTSNLPNKSRSQSSASKQGQYTEWPEKQAGQVLVSRLDSSKFQAILPSVVCDSPVEASSILVPHGELPRTHTLLPLMPTL